MFKLGDYCTSNSGNSQARQRLILTFYRVYANVYILRCVTASTIPSPHRKAHVVSAVLFSSFVGFITVIVTPMMAVIMAADYYREGTRRERLQLWQVAVLTATTALAFWTRFWVQPSDGSLLIATAPLWWFCALGISVSVALGLLQYTLTQRQRRLEDRLVRLVLQP